MIKYSHAPDIESKVINIVEKLGMEHVDKDRIKFVRSFGTKSRYIIARCHALPKIMQHALGTQAHYVIEVVGEKFDRMSEEDKTKTLIHELMHIPKSFGGGFRHHDYVCKRNVEKLYLQYSQQQFIP